MIAPETDHVMHLPDVFYNGHAFYQMVRELRDKSPLWIARIDEPTACEKWAFHVAQTFYAKGFWGKGTITTPPNDVVEALESLFGGE